MKSPWLRPAALLFALSMVAAACGSDSGGSTDAGSDGADTETTETSADEATEETTADDPADDEDAMVDDETAAGVDLSAVCPSPVIIQTDWNPEAEHGGAYILVGDDYTLDSDNFIVTGNLVAHGGADTGVDVEIRTGGPAIGYGQVTAQMYLDTDIHLGLVSTDEAVANFTDLPMVAVLSPLEKNPQIIMWDPETYPVDTIADLPDEAFIRYFADAPYMPYLVAEGIVTEGQLDNSYDGTPSVFVAEGGKIAQQGFASAEPYVYLNEVPEWGKPVAYQLIHDTGYEIYSQAISARAEAIDELSPCLELLVPIMQQAQVDYVTDPSETNALILEAIAAFDNGWVYSAGVADFSVETQLSEGLVGNGPDSTLGNFDMDRVAGVIDILVANTYPKSEGVTPEDIATNKFIDESIGL